MIWNANAIYNCVLFFLVRFTHFTQHICAIQSTVSAIFNAIDYLNSVCGHKQDIVTCFIYVRIITCTVSCWNVSFARSISLWIMFIIAFSIGNIKILPSDEGKKSISRFRRSNLRSYIDWAFYSPLDWVVHQKILVKKSNLVNRFITNISCLFQHNRLVTIDFYVNGKQSVRQLLFFAHCAHFFGLAHSRKSTFESKLLCFSFPIVCMIRFIFAFNATIYIMQKMCHSVSATE